ncbi:DUF2161 domain-containing phosphodiesterase [Acholeplasma laidlawii]|uniref:DUF2161 domain-containing phosphodiesterase n=1 Tax=Acholeplasma laidlawii TaxID=2148 RepID=UPI00084C4EA2|nr:DUF2161 family putative PD-(D/E)XK-type phosphodiesterase [Acholeplasma laidlawii]OED59004.1 hypothetical protein BHS12_05445 [Acholeplasma laidlawii]
MKETDLYEPCKALLESQGFEVKGEILKTDITAIKDNYIVIVELKTSISLKLIYQAIDRQKIADKVYVALPKKVVSSNRGSQRDFINLLRRLEIGLIVVGTKAEVLIETFGFDLKRSIQSSKKQKEKLIKEFSLRKSNSNLGGTSGKIMTHYKERVIEVAKYLYLSGEKSPKEIILQTGIKDTPSILNKNYYKWFLRVSRGIYTLTDLGRSEMEPYFLDDMIYE